MATCIEVHSVKPQGPGNRNAGYDGQQKTITVGGVTRAAVSAQSRKTVVREKTKERAIRTKVPEKLLTRMYEERNGVLSAEERDHWEFRFATFVGVPVDEKNEYWKALKKDDDTANKKTKKKTIMQYSIGELRNIVTTLETELTNEEMDLLDKGKMSNTLNKKFRRAMILGGMGIDIATNGRMSAQFPEYTVRSATHYNHSYSIDSYMEESDMFSAVDTFMRDAGIPGAGYFEEIGHSLGANTMYEYENIDPILIFDNLAKRLTDPDFDQSKVNDELDLIEEEIVECVKDTLKAMILTAPEGKQHTQASFPLPSIVAISYLKNGYPLTMDHCWNKVITPSEDMSIVESAAERMMDYYNYERPKQERLFDAVLMDVTTRTHMEKCWEEHKMLYGIEMKRPEGVDILWLNELENVINKVGEITEAALKAHRKETV